MGDEVISGTITYSKGTKKSNKKWAVLYRKTPTSVTRIEFHDSKTQSMKSSVKLDKCIKIHKIDQKDGKGPCIELYFGDDKPQILSAANETELERWLNALKSTLFAESSDENSLRDVFFDVEIKSTEITDNLKLKGKYFLNVSADDISLHERDTKQVVIKWPLHLLRKYGRDKQEFSLEAGRRCPTGEGMFYFVTDSYNAIFQEVEKNVKTIASRGRAQSTSSVGHTKSKSAPKAPHSPDMLAPASPSILPASSMYADPLDFRREISSGIGGSEGVYSEPINLKTAPKSVKKPGKDKPQPTKDKPKTGIFGKKKGPPPPGDPPKKPPRQHSAMATPEMVEEATYAETVDTTWEQEGVSSDYSSLNIGQGGQGEQDGEYDSISWTGAKKPPADPTYATTDTFNGGYQEANEDGVYDHVQR